MSRLLKSINSQINCYGFLVKKCLFGFTVANQYLRKVDNVALVRILIMNNASIGDRCDFETGPVFHNCSDYSSLIIRGSTGREILVIMWSF